MVEVFNEEIILKIKSTSPGEDLVEMQQALIQAIELIEMEELRASLIKLLGSTLLDNEQIDTVFKANETV